MVPASTATAEALADMVRVTEGVEYDLEPACSTCVELAGGVPALHPERRGQLNISPKVNWVEKRGGLPAYINSVATAHTRKGMPRRLAIKRAVGVIRNWCKYGTIRGEHGGPRVSGAVQAAACAALAQWNAMKVATSIPSDERLCIELARLWERDGDLERTIELAVRGAEKRIELAATPGTAERRKLAAKGQAMQGGRFPIRDRDDLRKAIRAVGRAKGSHDAVRRYIVRRARALGALDMVPSHWTASGARAEAR